MEQAPEVPTPPPEIPKGKLWTALLLPPAVMCFGSLLIALNRRHSSYGEEFLVMLPVGLVAILATSVAFVQAWGVRYHGRSLVLTTLGYILGQIILCLAVWFGCCLIPFR
jgi:hypothetical protein